MYRTLALAAALAPVTGFAPALRATARSVALKAKYTDANGNPIKAALSAYMHFCNDERATVTAEQKRLAGDSFKQTLVMTKLGALWRELPEAQKATYNQKARRGVDINQWVRLSTSTPSSRRRNGIVVASMAWNLDAVEQTQLRGHHRVDGVGRPKFDSTQASRRGGDGGARHGQPAVRGGGPAPDVRGADAETRAASRGREAASSA